MTQFNRLVLTASPKTTRKSLRTCIDTTLPPDERGKVSELGLYYAAYRITRDHLDRVRLSTLPGSEVQQMIAANGSSLVGRSTP